MIREAITFLHRKKPYGPTNVIGPLRRARETAELDAIVLLSDGLPNRGTPSKPHAILEAMPVIIERLREISPFKD